MEEEKRLHEVREKSLLEHSEMQSRFDNEKRNYMSQAESTIKSLQEKLEKMTNDKNELLDIRRDLESENKEQKQKIES